MPRIPPGDDFEAWVGQLAVSQRRQQAKRHLMGAGSAALPALRRGLRHPDPVVRRMCAGILDHLVDEDSIADLVAALDDEDPRVRARVLHALACDRCKQNECRPGDELFVPRAIELVREHPDANLRAAAIDAIAKFAARRHDVAEVLAWAIDHDPDAGLRNLARRRMQRRAQARERQPVHPALD